MEEKDIKTLNLYERILLVSAEVRNIEKNTTVAAGTKSQYKAVSDLDVTLAVKDAESRYRVLAFPVNQEIINSEVVTSHSNYGEKNEYVVDIKMTMRIINVDNPSEFIETCAYGKGIDTGDKGFGKASTYARKYCLLNAYKIATGEDPDKDASPATANKKREPKYQAPAPTNDPELELALQEVKEAKTLQQLTQVYNSWSMYADNAQFLSACSNKKAELKNNSVR